MIGFIKNLISSVLSFLVGLFGGKKSQEDKQNKSLSAEKPSANAKTRKRNGYFMELDEAEEIKSGNGNQPAKAEEADAKAQPAKAESAKPNKADAKSQPAKAESAKPNKADAKSQPAKESAKEVELVQTAQGVKAEPVKKEKAAASANGQTSTETTFAPKYLAPSAASSNGRRRPGPSMNNFLDMARQVKAPGKA